MAITNNGKQETYELTIMADSIVSTNPEFTMDNLTLGDNYKPLDAYYQTADGEIVKRNRRRSENKISNMTLPRIAFQYFESQIDSLSSEEKLAFPICRYRNNSEIIKGIYPSAEAFKKDRNTIEYLTYTKDNGTKYVTYCWNIFSTLIFVQECLKRFGKSNDRFVLVYTTKDPKNDWFPADYTPGFTANDWVDMLNDPEIFTVDNLKIMRRMKDIGGQAACSELSEKYGNTKNFYNAGSSFLGKRIYEKTNCPVLEENNENAKWWPILYVGREADDEEKGSYIWKLRDELSEALEIVDLSSVELYEANKNGEKMGYTLKTTEKVISSSNVIFHGAPGTGKTYLAKQIAADIISGGETIEFEELSDAQKEQFGFVQFHPSYDYTDFVEGLRPIPDDDGSLGFELKDGVFKEFVNKARRNFEESWKTQEDINKERSVEDALAAFFDSVEDNRAFKTKEESEFYITGVDDKNIYISIPENAVVKELKLNIEEIKKMLMSEQEFKLVRDVTRFFNKEYTRQRYSYYFVIWKEVSEHINKGQKVAEREELKNYVFLIDEINRGEISKIFGELFFSVDPGYRGVRGSILTQYSNLHDDPEERFYIPENVYIIGTMNDIDRSVDTFDFAMRRRFRFIKLHANEQVQMLDGLDASVRGEVVARMTSLNNAIVETPELNEDYQIGAAYFLKLAELDYDFDALWDNYLLPLVSEYVRGMYDEKEIIDRFKSAYDNISNVEENDAENF